jgi:hypothetical protein
MTDTEFAALLRSKRTQSQAEVDRHMRDHDKDDLRPSERLAQFGK